MDESNDSESKTPTARTEPKRRHGRKHSRSPSLVASVFRRLKQNRSPSQGLRARKGGQVPSKWERPGYRQESIIMRAHRPEELADIQRAKTAKGVTGSSNQKGTAFRKIIASKQNTLWISGDYITSSKRDGEFPRRISWRRIQQKESWTWKERRNAMKGKTTSLSTRECCRFSHGPGRKKKATRAPWMPLEVGNHKLEFQKGFQKQAQAGTEARQVLTSYKDPERNFRFRKRKIQGSTTNGKLSQFIKELKQSDKPKAPKKGDTTEKERPLAILMIQPWEKVAKQKVTQSFSPETTISFPPLGDEDGTEGPMIIEAETGGHFVHRMYVDGGASSEILYEHCFIRLLPEIRSQMVPPTTYLTGFSGETIWPLGQISLLVKIGRPGIRKIHAIPSMAHGMLKFPVEGGTVTLRSSRIIPMECAMISGPSTRPPEAGKILEEKIRVAIHLEYPEQTIAIGSTLMGKRRKELCTLLGQNLDVFAWKPADMTGVPRSIAEHRLNIREGCPPVRQKKRGQAPERNKAIQEEVEKLVDAGIMKEVHYHSWLSNPVMVKKHDGTWRMCVDFKDLNNACPKDCYPLPEIDWKIESLYAVGHEKRWRRPISVYRQASKDRSGATWRFEATNNEAEYEALIAGLRIAEQMGVKNLQAHVDSRLVANQVYGSYVGPNNQHDPIFEQSTNARKKLQGIFQQASTTEAKTRKADA
ncbi:reverse transcriptase domain-containing protein [Tanacetum coccineum]|uniref:Reverse transcriptase domain-containing protein n=1 Tax=Tanacetum coccineum TaxID=301880 RepID=A0ABQ5CCA5_9ASTR